MSKKPKKNEVFTKPLTVPRLVVEGAGNCADLIYRSGFHPVDPVVFLDEGTSQTLVVPMLEYSRAREEAKRVRVVLPSELNVPKEEARSLSGWAAHLLKQRKIKRVRVGAFFPAAVLRTLETHGVSVDISEGAMYPERARKTKSEIENIAGSQRAAVAALRAGHHVLREAEITRGGQLRWRGKILTSEILRGVIDETLLRAGCIARDTIVAGGAQAADPHERGHGPLRAGTSIVFDIFPQHKKTGYWGDITRTFCKGRPSPALAHMYQIVLRAQQKALAMIRPGVNGQEVYEMVAAFFEKAGYPTRVKNGVVRGFFHGLGHGVGLDIHEAPSLSRTDVKLQTGHVVTVEPGLYDPDIGGVRIEDTVVVEAKGARVLAAYPKKFLV